MQNQNQKTKKYLQYGALISISDNAKDKQIVYSDGFVRLNFQVASITQEVTSNDIDGCIFQIVPSYTYEYYEKLQNLLTFIEKEDIIANEKQYNFLFEQVQDEISNCLDLFKQLQNQVISFGQVVQFEHYKSKKYLTLDPTEQIPLYKESYGLKLQQKPSRNSMFKIIPCYTYQQEFSNLIKYGVDVYIISKELSRTKDLYLSTSNKKQLEENNKIITEYGKTFFSQISESKIKSDINVNDLSGDSTYDFFYKSDFLFANFQEKAKLRINLFRSEQESDNIFLNDCVWIIHMETNSSLIYNSEEENNTQLTLLFEQFYIKNSKNTIGLWKIEGGDIKAGEKLSIGQIIRFKNLNCKKYMTIIHNKVKIKTKQEFNFSLESEVTENSQFEIIPYQYYEQEYSQQNIINTRKIFFIKHCKTGRFLTKKIFSYTENGHELIQKPTLQKFPGQDDVFQFVKAQSFELQETLFLLSCQPPLIKGIKFINQINNQNIIQEQSQITNTDTVLFNEMKQSLLLLIQYCSIEVDILNEQQQLEEKFAQKQRILREQGYFELLSRIIQSCFPNKDIILKMLPLINMENSQISRKNQQNKINKSPTSISSQGKSEDQQQKQQKKKKFSLIQSKKTNEKITYFKEFMSVCDLCFQLIRTMCICNPRNQLMCFKYINKIKEQVGYIMGSTQCLRDILINNEQLLDLVHSKDIDKDYKLAIQQTKQVSIISDYHKPVAKNLNKFLKSNSFKNLNEHHIHEPMNTTLIDYIYQRFRESLKIINQKFTHLNEFLDFMNCLCCNKEKGISINQILCKTIMLDEQDYGVLLPVRLIKNDDGSLLEIGSQDQSGQIIFKDLITFFERFKSSEENEELNYIQKQLLLYSNLCKGRNYNNIAYFKPIFNSSTLIDYIWDQRICEPIRACLIELLHYIHVDSKPRSERIIPMLSKVVLEDNNNDKNNIFEQISQSSPSKQSMLEMMKAQFRKIQNVIKLDSNFNIQMLDSQQSIAVDQIELQANTLIKLENIVSDFLIYEDSISMTDNQNLKQKIIDYFVKEIFNQDSNGNHNHIFSEISINLIILVRKLMKFNFFENSKQEISNGQDEVENRLQRVKTVIDIKYQLDRSLISLQSDDPLYKLIRALLQILNKDIEVKLDVSKTAHSVVFKSFTNFLNSTKKVQQDSEEKKIMQGAENVIKRQVIEQMKFQIKLDQNQLLEEKQKNNNENKFKIELLRNLIYFNEMRQDHYLQRILEFILTATNECGSPPYTQNQVDDYILKNINKYIPNIMINEITKNDDPGQKELEDLDSLFTGKSVFSILIKYFHISNDQLFSFLIIKLIIGNFNQRAFLIKNLKHLQIIQNPNELVVFNEIRTKAIQLNFDAEQSEVWLQTSQYLEGTQISYAFVIHRIIDNVQHLIELAYQDSSMENTSISNVRQIMFRNIKVHDIIISLVKDCGDKLKEQKYNQKPNTQESLLINLFCKCYKFLQVFIQNHNRMNIKLMIKEYDTLTKQLNYIELGQTEFFCSLYNDNYDLICNLNPQIINQFINKIIVYGFNPLFINFFETIMYYKDQPYYQNWNKILDIILDYQLLLQIMMIRQNTKYEEGDVSQLNILQIPKTKPLKIERQEDEISNVRSIGRFIFDFEEKQINRSVPYIYHFQIIKIVNKLIENSAEKLQIGQTLFQKVLDINYIFYLISKRDIFHPKFEQTQNGVSYILNTLIKQESLKFLNIIYLKSSAQTFKQIKNNPYLIKFLTRERKLLENIKDQIQLRNMQSFYEQSKSQFYEKKSYQNLQSEILSKNSKYMDQIESNFVLGQISLVMPVITLLYKKLIHLSDADEIDHNRQDIVELVNYATELEKFCSRMDIDYHDMSPLLEKNIIEYQNTLQCDLNILTINIGEQHNDHEINTTEKKLQENNHLYTIDEIIEIPLQDIITQKNIKAYDDKEIAWRSVVVSMLQSTVLEEQIIKKEQDFLIEAIIKIDNFSSDKLKLDLSIFIKKILQFLQDLMFYRQDSESFLKNELNEIPCIINQIMDFLIRLVQTKREEIQGIFQKETLINFVGKMICGKEIQDQTFFLLIDLSNELLDGGQKELQDQFLYYFQSEKNGEQLFFKIHSFLEEEIQLVKQKNDINFRMRKINKNIRFCYKQNKQPRITRVMRFLQLLCEGHNTNCQIYIRKQQNNIGSSQNNYDILQLMVQLIDIYFKKLNEENYGKASQTLDTLIEALQGPCEENQLALSEGKLLETLSIIVSVFLLLINYQVK